LFLCFIQGIDSGLIRVCLAENVDMRLHLMQENSPERLHFLAYSNGGSYSVAECIRNMFADDKVHGEWFRPTPALIAFISDIDSGDFCIDALNNILEKQTGICPTIMKQLETEYSKTKKAELKGAINKAMSVPNPFPGDNSLDKKFEFPEWFKKYKEKLEE